jgi:hypothetical protein
MEPCGAANTCRAVLDDPTNCGGCGVRCGDRQYCGDGSCVCRPGLTLCGGTCVNTSSNDENCGRCGFECTGDSTDGDSCREGRCRDGCGEGFARCDPNEDTCVSGWAMRTDPINCGDCNEVCGTSQVCTGEACRTFSIGRGCTTCPCPDCGTGNCCVYPGTADLVVCLDARTPCP